MNEEIPYIKSKGIGKYLSDMKCYLVTGTYLDLRSNNYFDKIGVFKINEINSENLNLNFNKILLSFLNLKPIKNFFYIIKSIINIVKYQNIFMK